MRTRALSSLIVAAAAVLTTIVFAQPRERTLFTLVLDKSGNPVPDLGVADFIVREDGATREVLRVSRAIVPMDIAVLVDTSAASEPDVVFLRNGLEVFIDALTTAKPAHQLALVTFGERPEVRSDYTPIAAQLKKAVGSVFARPGSGAYLLEALEEVSRGLQKRDAERAVFVVVHTEGPEFSTSHYDAVVDSIRRAGAKLIVLTLASPGGDLQSQEARNRAIVIDRGTKATGGYREILLSNQGLPDRMKKLADQLLNQYQVVYGRPDTLIPPEKIDVAVRKPELVAHGTLARTPVKTP